MQINIFDDPNKVPQPRQNVKIERVTATPYPDGFRVRLEVVVTAFQERPNLLLVVRDAEGRLVNEMSVIATMHAEMEFTLHMRHTQHPHGDYVVYVELYYDTRNPPHDTQSTDFTLPAQGDA